MHKVPTSTVHKEVITGVYNLLILSVLNVSILRVLEVLTLHTNSVDRQYHQTLRATVKPVACVDFQHRESGRLGVRYSV